MSGLSDNAQAAVTAPALTQIDGAGIERGIAHVVCQRQGSELATRVRAVVLDLGETEPAHDVLLAPAHALPQDTKRIKDDCRVYGGQRSPEKIAEFWLPEYPLAGTNNDWVILMTRSQLDGPVGRLRAGHVSQRELATLIAEEKPIGVMLLRQESDQRDCRILELLRQRMVFSHSCPAWAGLSGSPIIIGIDNEPVVIGIQIASSMRPTHLGGPLFHGIGLSIDNAITEAIRQAAASARD